MTAVPDPQQPSTADTPGGTAGQGVAADPRPAGGYDPAFCGVVVPIPVPRTARPPVELAYTHFTVLLDRDRRLAAVTAVNIDGAALQDVGRDDDWQLDPRVPADEQAGPSLYKRNDLDRGHLVRRRDPVWGDRATAERANADTFVYTNAAPQAAHFNQSKELWLGVEDHVLHHADVHDLKFDVLTGPVLDPADPTYRGVQIPLQFYKIAAWATDDGALAATGFVLEQRPDLSEMAAWEAGDPAAEGPPPLGPFRTFQVPVADIGRVTGMDLSQLASADRLAVPPTETFGRAWVELGSTGDIRL
jgi:endonuclease G